MQLNNHWRKHQLAFQLFSLQVEQRGYLWKMYHMMEDRGIVEACQVLLRHIDALNQQTTALYRCMWS